MADTFDLEELVHLEQTFYDVGYTDGFDHGRVHGLIEGRALGGEKGFEIWEEIGFYEGFASTWRAVCAQRGREDQRALHHIHHLLDLIHQFPTANPSTAPSQSHRSASSSGSEDEIDVSTLQRQIRSRYKALCASLGVRPTLRARATSGAGGAAARDENAEPGLAGDGVTDRRLQNARRDVWTLEGNMRQGLSF